MSIAPFLGLTVADLQPFADLGTIVEEDNNLLRVTRDTLKWKLKLDGDHLRAECAESLGGEG